MSRNLILALVAVVLGLMAIPGDPYHGEVVKLNTRELATIVEAEVDHVEALELADWIIQGIRDYRLIDIRDEASFAGYHIPSAESAPMSVLADYPLLRNETIVLYSDGGIHSAQAWFLLKARGYRGVYMLLGGLDAWKDEVLFPALPAGAGPAEQEAFEKARFVSEHFGGRPRSGVEAAAAEEVPLPTVEMPAQTVPVAPRKKKSKEGC